MWEQERVAGLGTGGAYVEFFVIPKASGMGLILVLGAAQRDPGDESSGKAQLPKEHIQSLLLIPSLVCAPGSCLPSPLFTQTPSPSAPRCDWHSSQLPAWPRISMDLSLEP